MKLARSVTVAVLAIALIGLEPALAAELSPKTLEAFEEYVRLTELRMDRAVHDTDAFLWIDALPPTRRSSVYARLRQGEVVVTPLRTEKVGKPLSVPGALLLHSIGVIFLPGATLQRTVALLQDYDHHADLYAPGVRRSKILHHDGDDFLIYRQLLQKKIVTVALNTEFRVHYAHPGPTRIDCRSNATRIAQVVDVGRPTERERPLEADSTRLRRLLTFCRLEERDGGTYMEYETLFVGPEIPLLFRWLAGPIVRSLAAETETNLLKATRRVLATTAPPASRQPPHVDGAS